MDNLLPRHRSRRATVRDVRRTNQAVLLQRLFFGGSMSRQQLVEATGLSAGTVTTVVNGLLGQGLLIEAGTEDSDGGRPRILLEVARDRAVAVGVDVGETRVRIEAFDLSLRKIAGEDRLVTTLDLAPERAVDAIVNGIEALLRRVGADLCSVAGVGVGVSGIVEDREGLVHAASIGWQAVPFASLLRRQLAVPIRVDNGAKTMGQAEMWFGAGRGVPNAAVALLGTGVGAAVFTDGQLYRGAHSSAGEWGHVPVAVGGRICRCGSRGCLEAYVGGWAIAQRWRDMVGGPAGDQEAALGAFAAAIGVDPRADELADEFAEYLGAGLGTLVNLFNPERIVVAGWVGLKLGPALLQRIRDHTRSYALRRPYEQVEIVLGQLGADAVALGAATLVVDGILVGDLPVPARGKRPDEAARVALPA
jgi:predicted NBD/HSP70 family sugar kinase